MYERQDEMLELRTMLEMAAGHIAEGNHPLAAKIIEKLIDAVNSGMAVAGMPEAYPPE